MEERQVSKVKKRAEDKVGENESKKKLGDDQAKQSRTVLQQQQLPDEIKEETEDKTKDKTESKGSQPVRSSGLRK